MSELMVVEGQYFKDILDQPRALEETLRSLVISEKLQSIGHDLSTGKFRQVVLTGMGSSLHALHTLRLRLIASGITALMIETSELVHYESGLFGPQTLIVAVSQSGESVEMLRLVAADRKKSILIAITNTENSALAKGADVAVLTRAGKESSVSCKTYVATLAALRLLGDVLTGYDFEKTRRELTGVPLLLFAYLSQWKEHVRQIRKITEGIRQMFLVGRGASLAAAATGALIIKESDHFPAEGMSSAAFRHGPFEMLGPGTFVVVFEGDETTLHLNIRLLEDIRAGAGRAALIGTGATESAFLLAPCSEVTRPILEILPVQMLTLALAAHVGREAGKFEFATKITAVE